MYYTKTYVLQYKYYKFFENDPLFHQREYKSLDEARRLTTLRIYKALHANLVTENDILANPSSVSKIKSLIIDATYRTFQKLEENLVFWC